MTRDFTPAFDRHEKMRESNLTPELQKFVRTPEFTRWFGDWENDPESASKLLDENGEPLLIYAGLPAGIREIDGDHRLHTGKDEVGIYFTKRYHNARSMATQRCDPETGEPVSASVYSAFVSIRHPHYKQKGGGVNTMMVLPEEIPPGVDGYVNDRMQEVVVFDPAQLLIVSEERIS